jgi:hypothetical protein
VTAEQVAAAADDLKAVAEHQAEVGFADRHDRIANLSNACVLLRLCNRHAEIVELLQGSPAATAGAPQLRLQLALALTMFDRREEARLTLAGDSDAENRLYALELLSADDPEAALGAALEIGTDGLGARLATLRWRLIAELSLACGNLNSLGSAAEGLRALDPSDLMPAILELRGMRLRGLEKEEARARLLGLARQLPGHAGAMTRYFLAQELRMRIPTETSRRFRCIPAGDSDGSQPVIPMQASHP